jgi:hypothetical protein
MASSSTPAAVREMQKDLEVQANALSKIQKGTRSPYSHESPSHASASKSYLTSDLRCSSSPADIAKNHQVRKQYTIQVGENELVLKACTRPALPDFLVRFSSETVVDLTRLSDLICFGRSWSY